MTQEAGGGSIGHAGALAASLAGPVPTNLRARLSQRLGQLCSRENRRLLAELIRAEQKASEYNSVLGLAWSLLSPGAMLLVLYLVFSSNLGASVPAYPLYLLVGIVLVNFFLLATRQMIGALAHHAPLLLATTAPRETIIAAKLATHVSKLLVELGLCVGLSIYAGLFSWWSLLLLAPLLVAYLGLVFGVGLLLAILYAFARDIDHIWGIVARLLFFATPVFYQLDALPAVPRAIITWLSPLTPFLLGFRAALMGGHGGTGSAGESEAFVFGQCLLLGVGVLAAGVVVFVLFQHRALEQV